MADLDPHYVVVVRIKIRFPSSNVAADLVLFNDGRGMRNAPLANVNENIAELRRLAEVAA
jgi:hypothetical protein